MNNIYLRKCTHAQTVLCELASGDLVRVDVRANDVLASRREGGPVVAIWNWYQHNRPTRRNRYVMLNCVRHSVIWLENEQ